MAEERFQALSDASFEGVVVVRDGRVVDSNQAFASMLGYGRDELEGHGAVDRLGLLEPLAGRAARR